MMMQMAYSVAVLLIVLSTGTFLMSCLFKLESCFPFPVDPSGLHGSRLNNYDKAGRVKAVAASLGTGFGLQASMGGKKRPGEVSGGKGKYMMVLDDSSNVMA